MTNNSLEDQIVKAISSVVGDAPVSLHEPLFIGNEWNYLKDCLDSTYVSSVGTYVDKFEEALKNCTGAKYAIAVVNGTSALQMSLQLAGVSFDCEVLVPALSFVATANAVTYAGGIPHFVECEESTLGIDADRLMNYLADISVVEGGQCINRSTGRVIKSVVPMHTFGHPVNMKGLMNVAKTHKLSIVEDAAESLGSAYAGRHTGTIGLLGILSFNGNKTITTGGGGAILTNDSELASLAKHLTTTAKINHDWEFSHDRVGYNFRLPNINAALGCAQLEQLPKFIEAKRSLFAQYKRAFAGVDQLRLVAEPENSYSNYWLQTLLLSESVENRRDDILSETNRRGIQTRPSWNLLHTLKPYKDCPRMDLPVAESLQRRIINIPSSSQLAGGLVD